MKLRGISLFQATVQLPIVAPDGKQGQKLPSERPLWVGSGRWGRRALYPQVYPQMEMERRLGARPARTVAGRDRRMPL
jgi:hypothetical protein